MRRLKILWLCDAAAVVTMVARDELAEQECHEGDAMRMKILLGVLLVAAVGGVAAQKLEPLHPGCGK